jgi:hypothetical protein
MNIQKIIKALRNHANEEVRIHKDLFTDAKIDIKKMANRHLKDTVSTHKAFWKELKVATKSKASNK